MGNDPDELIIQAFSAYDQGGKIDVKMFQHALSTWGDKMTKAEIDDIFNEFEVDEDYMSRLRRFWVCSLQLRRRRRRSRRRSRLLRRPLRRKREMLRRRRRRRRRPPSK